MLLVHPNSNGEDGRPTIEVNHCHGAGKGHPCEGGATSAPAAQKPVSARTQRRLAQWKAVLDKIDRNGSVVVQVGTEGGRRFGQRQHGTLMQMEKAGLIERVPGHSGVMPIASRASWMNNKTRGYVSEHVYRRKKQV